MTANERDRDQREPVKKPYESPRLDVYGDIREVTDAVGFMGMTDGGHGFRRRTA
jgi:hypothetical protein